VAIEEFALKFEERSAIGFVLGKCLTKLKTGSKNSVKLEDTFPGKRTAEKLTHLILWEGRWSLGALPRRFCTELQEKCTCHVPSPVVQDLRLQTPMFIFLLIPTVCLVLKMGRQTS
jgi:hypothetical protein